MKNPVSAVVVDDSVSMRRYVSTLLQGGMGISVVLEAENADDAVHLIRANENLKVGCVLSDLEMPGMHAKDFVAFLRGNPVTAHVPCVLLSARKRKAAESIALRNGFTDYLSKPFSPELFVEKMSRIWSGKEKRRARRVSPCIFCEIDLGLGDKYIHALELVNISMTGCLVRVSVSRLPSVCVYDLGVIRLRHSDDESTTLHGSIVRIETDFSRSDDKFSVIAFNFAALDEDNREKLGDYIESCDKSAR